MLPNPRSGNNWYDPGLPPPDARLYDPRKDGKIPTPVDDRGFVQVDKLIKIVQATIDPSYEWPAPCDVHHFYWKRTLYRGRAELFRELPIHKGLMPRQFHNWLHPLTEMPPVPSREAMEYRIEAWDVAKSLFANGQEIIRWERRARRRMELLKRQPHMLPASFEGEDLIGQAVISEIMDRNFRGREVDLERLDRLPQEFRLVEPSDNVPEMTSTLGKLVMPGSVNLVPKLAA